MLYPCNFNHLNESKIFCPLKVGNENHVNLHNSQARSLYLLKLKILRDDGGETKLIDNFSFFNLSQKARTMLCSSVVKSWNGETPKNYDCSLLLFVNIHQQCCMSKKTKNSLSIPSSNAIYRDLYSSLWIIKGNFLLSLFHSWESHYRQCDIFMPTKKALNVICESR